jgi:hypothetical protein
VFTGTRRERPFQARPGLEALEDRCLLSGNVLQTNLVSDLPGVAQVLDRNLVNPWGISESPSSPFWDVFNPTTGQFLGNLKDPDGEPIQIDRLWALKVGNGGAGGDANTVYFTAGLDNETHGLFGSLTPVAPGTPEGPAEQQMVTALLDEFQLAVQTFNTDLSSGASKAQLRQDREAVETALRDFVRAEVNLVLDTSADQGGHHSSHHDLDDMFSILGNDDSN